MGSPCDFWVNTRLWHARVSLGELTSSQPSSLSSCAPPRLTSFADGQRLGEVRPKRRDRLAASVREMHRAVGVDALDAVPPTGALIVRDRLLPDQSRRHDQVGAYTADQFRHIVLLARVEHHRPDEA